MGFAEITSPPAGTWKKLVAYLSKRLDSGTARHHAYIRAIAATTLVVKAADKLILGQELFLMDTPSVEALLGAGQHLKVGCNAQVT